MTRGELPDELRRFILTSIPSVPYLEAILLLRSGRERPWDAPLVARRLYLGDRQSAELLGQLAAAGIARHDAAQPQLYSYHPATAELDALLESLAKAYATDLLTVTGLIHSRIDKRAQQFADAFRLRKEP